MGEKGDSHLRVSTIKDSGFTGVEVSLHIKTAILHLYMYDTLSSIIHVHNYYNRYIHDCTCTCFMRDEKEERKKQARSSKQGQTNNKAKQHSTPKVVTFMFVGSMLKDQKKVGVV